MKILVLSDSHSGISFMRQCVHAVHPDVLIHLGDYYDDGQIIAQEFPNVRMYQVPGNCDRFRCLGKEPEILCPKIDGLQFYLSHGHLHQVKSTYGRIISDARGVHADCVLFGHTHESCCEQLEDGLWIMNPGSCGSHSGSCGLIETQCHKIITCQILRQVDLEGFL